MCAKPDDGYYMRDRMLSPGVPLIYRKVEERSLGSQANCATNSSPIGKLHLGKACLA